MWKPSLTSGASKYQSNTKAFLSIFCVVLFEITVIALIVLTIARQALHSKAKRWRTPHNKKHIQILLFLTTLSFVVQVYYAVQTEEFSYKIWALERGITIPSGLFGHGGVFGGINSVKIHVQRWLDESMWAEDARTVVLSQSKRYWWTQQHYLGMIAFTVLLSIEGHRHNIPYLWAYLFIARTTSISFAQNLFFLYLLVTPAQSRSTSLLIPSPPPFLPLSWKRYLVKPPTWTPYASAYIIPLSLMSIGVFLLPLAVHTPELNKIEGTIALLNTSILFLPTILPLRFGTKSPSAYHKSSGTVIRSLSILSLFLHLKQTFVALADNDPGALVPHHSIWLGNRSPLEHSSSALSRILLAPRDHPALVVISWDIILSTISLFVWVVIRNVDVQKVLICVPGLGQNITVPDANKTSRKPGRRGTGSKRKSDSSQASLVDGDTENELEVGALALGLGFAGGYGLMAAGVYGGEITSRG
ncbi:MAG: hypothetical protein M1834_006049 [Cirrosporium novae-zelandiae]|nr:MAG: hypothetical protein M1834_006049 [Cirrosporium novae-zelandiae]